ncbi:MAG: hypothetical protein JW885_03550 [Deltaproteobacteria bacterium]|nr:hypothetical protein [Candidatus Zymogenaceae bacterium]
MMKKIATAAAFILVVVVIPLTIWVMVFAAFPGGIVDPEYETETVGVETTFHEGVVYRYPDVIPLVSVTGDHYEMGLQYGVLLKDEILTSLDEYERIFRFIARDEGIPYRLLVGVMKLRTRKIAKKLPERFIEEARGVSAGSGVPLDTVLMVSLFYDVSESLGGCTSVLMRGEDGGVIHARNNDFAFLDALDDLSVVVTHNATGFYTVTHIDWYLGMGVETGYNDHGLTYSEETLGSVSPNAEGFSLTYLARIAMEEKEDLDGVMEVFDTLPTIGGYGTVWADLDAGEGAVIEVSPTGWTSFPLGSDLIWNLNHYYDEAIREIHQSVYKCLKADDWDRELVASSFDASNPPFDIADALSFVRNRTAPDGTDLTRFGSACPVCNNHGWQMMIFDPNGDGFYYSWGGSYAALNDVWRIYQDFSRPPEIAFEAIPVDEYIKEHAAVDGMLLTDEEKLDEYVKLAKKYPNEANAQFYAAYSAFLCGRPDLLIEYAPKAYDMRPDVAEYRLFDGLSALTRGDAVGATALLSDIDDGLFTPYQQIIRYAALERAEVDRADTHRGAYEAIVSEYGAEDYYEKRMCPLIDALAEYGE